jgi:hypothetical protein
MKGGEGMEIDVVTQGQITGRNGTFGIKAVRVFCYGDQVWIDGVGKRGRAIKGGLMISVKAMDEMADRWIAKRWKEKEKGRAKT